jgi:hypothetical protein
MINRLLYAATALALLAVVVLDGNFAANLGPAFGSPLPVHVWESYRHRLLSNSVWYRSRMRLSGFRNSLMSLCGGASGQPSKRASGPRWRAIAESW